MSKKYLKFFLNIFIFLICLYLLYINIDFSKVFEQIKKVHFYIFFFTVLISVCRAWLMGLRWESLHPDRESQLSKWLYFKLTMLSHLFNKFMPGALGGDIVKTLYIVKDKKNKRMKNVIAVIVDRAIGLMSIFLFGFIAIIFTKKNFNFNYSQLILVFLLSVGIIGFFINDRVVLFFQKLSSRIKFKQNIISKMVNTWQQSVSFYKSNKKKLLYSFSLCIPIHLFSFINFFIFAKAIGMQIAFSELVFVIAIMWLITSLPISIGGMGVRELSLIWLLAIFNVSSEMAVTLSVMAYINNLFIAILALPLLFEFKKKSDEVGRNKESNNVVENIGVH